MSDMVGWLKAAIPYYAAGKHETMPPQPRFNSGDMWFLIGIIPTGLWQFLVIIHDLAFNGTGIMFIVHFYLAVIHPAMWQSLSGTRFGYVSESCAKEHNTKWYFGEERAQEMSEQQKAAGGH